MRQAFQAIDPAITDATFLRTFQSSGHYLLDLCPEPVDRLDALSRREEGRKGEQSHPKPSTNFTRPSSPLSFVPSSPTFGPPFLP
jgi:hypothetical protein